MPTICFILTSVLLGLTLYLLACFLFLFYFYRNFIISVLEFAVFVSCTFYYFTCRFDVTSLHIGVQTLKMEMLPPNAELFSWESYNEDVSSIDDRSTFIAPGLLEQINVTRDTSDYLWYITR